MNKKHIEKNRLDLAYKRQLYFLNFILIIGAGSLISLFISFILDIQKWFNYTTAFVVIAVIMIIIYIKIDEKLKQISDKLKDL